MGFQTPNNFKYHPTIVDAIQIAGGISPDANIDKVEIGAKVIPTNIDDEDFVALLIEMFKINGFSSNYSTILNTALPNEEDEEVEDYFSIENIIAVDDFDANHYVKIKLTKGAWDLPANYIGKKSPEGTDLNEFLVKVNVTQPGYEPNSAEGLKPTDPFTKYYGLNDSEQEIISGGTINHGVENAQFDIDARVAFDWLSDIPGEYSISLTLSVVDGS